MKISEIKGEKALEVVADLIDPISAIVADDVFKKLIKEDKKQGIKHLLKNHPKTVISILAIINGENPDTYEPQLIALPKILLDLFNDPDIMNLFGLQSQNTELASSGSAMENIEA